MNHDADAYGQEILAAYEGRPSYEVVERDDGFLDPSGGAAHYFQEYKSWPRWQKQGIKFVKGRVLDIGSGAGRISLYLQRRGHKVTAIDNSPLAIEVCKKRGVKDARVLPIEKIGDFKENPFDTIVMYGNNFGLFGSRRKAKLLLKRMYGITSPEALIIAESIDPYDRDDPAHLNYQKRNRKRGRMAGQLRIRIRFRNYVGRWFDYLVVCRREMKEILEGTGWKIKKFIDSGAYMYIAIIAKN
jgi:SAM-dependent methyltransferase